MGTIRDPHALDVPVIVYKAREFRNAHIRWTAASIGGLSSPRYSELTNGTRHLAHKRHFTMDFDPVQSLTDQPCADCRRNDGHELRGLWGSNENNTCFIHQRQECHAWSLPAGKLRLSALEPRPVSRRERVGERVTPCRW